MAARKLNKKQVIEICKALNKGARLIELSKQYDVTLTAISLIANKRTHKDIGDKYLKDRIRNQYSFRNPNAKFTPAEVRRLRKLKLKGSIAALARKHGVAPSTMWSLLHNETYYDI